MESFEAATSNQPGEAHLAAPDHLHFRVIEITAPALVETTRRQVLAQHPGATEIFGTHAEPNPHFQVFHVLLYGTWNNQTVQVWAEAATYITTDAPPDPDVPEHADVRATLTAYAATGAMIPWAEAPAFIRNEHLSPNGHLRLSTEHALPLL